MKKILIELIISNQCNKRCEYCDLNFRNNEISDENLEKFLEFIEKSNEEITINFFGGEPLLNFGKIKNIVDNTFGKVKKFSIGTNGRLLNEKILKYLSEKNFSIYLSIDNIDNGKFLNFDLLSNFKNNFFINFILDPDYINFENSKKLGDFLIEKGFEKFNLMPVYTTKKWKKKSLIELQKISNYFSENKKIILNKYSYFNGISSDLQYILETDGTFYQDIDSLLWLQKQYKILPNFLKEKIEQKTKIGKLGEISDRELLEKYNEKELLNLLFEIPKKLKFIKINKIISLIINGKIKIADDKK